MKYPINRCKACNLIIPYGCEYCFVCLYAGKAGETKMAQKNGEEVVWVNTTKTGKGLFINVNNKNLFMAKQAMIDYLAGKKEHICFSEMPEKPLE